ncbi:GTP cyclohydrolase I [Uncinocarpus reesii 1704]|uniref:GTP cyclohydrolase 1 n=1 Tax=Uncinocarpus reesii (strain UAMH 1704) TaxID=336963 RepID=C4JM52_UNCRE|nr:GTP cyclohydrolase I [Uncinocarpus reesii 1704]EEP79064.1 GTP cyclohydrolase I [Uncinocarpus reesii 1704]
MGSETSPPLGPKPKSAIPSYLINGGVSDRMPSRKRERDSLNSSIQTSFARTQISDEEIRDNGISLPIRTTVTDAIESRDSGRGLSKQLDGSTDAKRNISEPPRDPRDHMVPTPLLSRPASPYTLNPPIDFDGLSWPSIGTRARLESTPEETEQRIQKLAGAVRTIFECIGEDPEREGLLGTPERYAKAMLYFTKGYEENVRDLVNGAVFHEDHDELVIVKDIEVFSLCEHHMVPFTGKMHIGYIPDRRVLGLSKLARLAEMFSRRLQVQERLTKQVALAIAEVLKPQGVAVVMESSHLCMVMRGVQKTGSTTTTSCMLGCMRSSAKTREEFLSLLNRK